MFIPEPIQPVKHRYLVIDSLRGLAIAGIFLFHSTFRFNFPSTYTETIPVLSTLGKLTENAAYLFLFGKMFGIFSFFFGFTFQLQNAGRRGLKKFRIIWRMLILMFFGFFNSLFIPIGDILILYALIGILITPIFFLRTPVLFVIAIILLLQPFELYRLFTSFFNPVFSTSPGHFTGWETEINQTLLSGDFLKVIKTNLVKGVPASFLWDFYSGRLSQVPGIFILGIIASRKGIFLPSNLGKKFWLNASLSLGSLILIIWFFKRFSATAIDPIGFKNNLDAILVLWINTLSTFLIISIFTLLYYVNRGKIFHPLSYLGKMSLTNYMTQSVIGALLFSSYGLNLANTIAVIYGVLLTSIFLLIQIILSRAWLRKYLKGPIETLWFYLTWIDKQLIKKH